MSAAAETRAKNDRGALWKRFGSPTDQVGSVNDPRTREEQGLVWNEKWIYMDPDTGETERIVLWNRYDLLGVFRVRSDGSFEAEPLG